MSDNIIARFFKPETARKIESIMACGGGHFSGEPQQVQRGSTVEYQIGVSIRGVSDVLPVPLYPHNPKETELALISRMGQLQALKN